MRKFACRCENVAVIQFIASFKERNMYIVLKQCEFNDRCILIGNLKKWLVLDTKVYIFLASKIVFTDDGLR